MDPLQVKYLQPIASDWDATVLVKGGTVYEYDISADEGIANGYGDFSSYWVSLHLMVIS